MAEERVPVSTSWLFLKRSFQDQYIISSTFIVLEVKSFKSTDLMLTGGHFQTYQTLAVGAVEKSRGQTGCWLGLTKALSRKYRQNVCSVSVIPLAKYRVYSSQASIAVLSARKLFC